MHLTFRGRCIVIHVHSYNKNEQDALFLKLILVWNCTGFGQVDCQSSGI